MEITAGDRQLPIKFVIQKYSEIIKFHKNKLKHYWPRVLCVLWLLKGPMNVKKYVVSDANSVPQM